MPPRRDSTASAGRRTQIIDAIGRAPPLSWFALVALIIEGLLAAMATRVDGTNLTVLVSGMVGAFILVIIIVAFLLVRGRLSAARYTVILMPPKDIRSFDLTQVTWNTDKCKIRCANFEMPIRPAFGAVAAYEIRIPPEVIGRADDEPIAIDLYDEKGNRWRVRGIYLGHTSVELETEIVKIKESYGGAQ